MKIALFGYGKMGQLIDQTAQNQGYVTIARFSRKLGIVQDRLQDLDQADIAIDFSQSTAVLEHLQLCLALKKPIVIGTTGWDQQLPQAQQMVREAGGSCLYAPNFSIGMVLFQAMMGFAASLFQPFASYDVSGIEVHHRDKLDQPSGTAKILKQKILNSLPRVTDFHFSSVRFGYIPGTHTIHFDSPADTLTFTHEARNRQGFADGALLAAEWLLPRQGFFTIEDMMQDFLRGTK